MIAEATKRDFSIGKFLRTLAGLLLAPVVGGALAMLGALLVESRGVRADEWSQGLFFGALAGGLLGVIPALLIGWPVHLLLLKLRWTSVWTYTGLGGLIGLGAVAISAMIPG
jgi:hypothetical protein